MVEYNPYAYEIHEDPYPVYRELREQAPLYRNEALGFWALSRHADVLTAIRDTRHYTNRFGVSLDRSSHENADAVMSFLAMDPPRHTRMRALVSRAFTPRRVSALEPSIRKLTNHFIDRFIDAGRCDFIDDFAGKLPMAVISEMLGVPEADREMLRTWADTIVHREDGMTDVPPAGMEAAAHALRYFDEMVDARAVQLGDDLTSALIEAELDGERLQKRDVVAFLHLMIIAGNETTTKLLGNALYWLWRNPGERDKVRADPGRIPGWVEETLRYDNSTQALARTVQRSLELRGEKLREGDKLVLLIGSANRDERAFPDPDRFDVERDTTGSLSFGQGTHFCLGASLARLEGRVALEEVQRRLPDFEIEPAGIERVHSCNVRGFARLPIGFSR
ncbi:MAG: cytochrome P450 [Deltaproteobacteria bacterium]|nr:MAG: cytochrome P450 [Deltaproteobacteria bacterium]